ncbi:MAG: hypothetical protein V4549_03565 [Bacteroidota bacterium]
MPKKKPIKLTEILAEKALRKTELGRYRKCKSPFCKKKFCWKNTKVGQQYCSIPCVLNDPNRLIGRKSVVDEEALSKLRYAFMVGSTDDEACEYAGISTTALQHYQEKNSDFKLEKQGLKNSRVLKSRIKIYGDIDYNIDVAKWNLEKLRKKEYGTKVSFDAIVFNGEMDPAHKKRAKEIFESLDE